MIQLYSGSDNLNYVGVYTIFFDNLELFTYTQLQKKVCTYIFVVKI